MPKKSCCPEPTGGIPAWFMTYSDVITLLMTFFILLLTFASSEPEFFSKVQVVAFGGGGSTGVAAEADDVLDKDSIVLRERPNSAAVTTRGSETPPVFEDPATESVSRGLRSLENPDALADAERVKIDANLSLMRNEKGEITEQAVTQLKMLAQQLKSQPLSLHILVSDPDAADFCVTMGVILADEFGVVPGRISVGLTDITKVPQGRIQYQLSLSKPN
jgi:flagellar motor protein MotB